MENLLLDAVDAGAEIHAWNANFEFNVWNNICAAGQLLGWPEARHRALLVHHVRGGGAGLP